MVKNLPAVLETWIPGLGRSLGEGNSYPIQYTYLKMVWTEEPDRVQSMGSQRVGHDWVTNTFTFHFSSVYSVQFTCSVMSDSLQPHEPQHARPPCPSPTPRVHSNPCPLSQWCHLTISSSVVPFSCPQSFPASASFQWVSCHLMYKVWFYMSFGEGRMGSSWTFKLAAWFFESPSLMPSMWKS